MKSLCNISLSHDCAAKFFCVSFPFIMCDREWLEKWNQSDWLLNVIFLLKNVLPVRYDRAKQTVPAPPTAFWLCFIWFKLYFSFELFWNNFLAKSNWISLIWNTRVPLLRILHKIICMLGRKKNIHTDNVVNESKKKKEKQIKICNCWK